MPNRFPPLSAPITTPLDQTRGSLMPFWLRSFPMGELLVFTGLGLFLALA